MASFFINPPKKFRAFNVRVFAVNVRVFAVNVCVFVFALKPQKNFRAVLVAKARF